MPSLKEVYGLGGGIPRVRITPSTVRDLELERVALQYFIGENGRGQVPKIVERELFAPPTDPNIIRQRQMLTKDIGNADSLTSLEKEVEKLGFIAGFKPDIHEIGCSVAKMYCETLQSIVERITSESYATLRTEIGSLLEKTELTALVEKWKSILMSGVSIHANILERVFEYKLPGESIDHRDENLSIVKVKNEVEQPFIERFKQIKPQLDIFAEELMEVVSFYVALAKYNNHLNGKGLGCWPEIADEIGYCDVAFFYNPLIGLPTVNRLESKRGQFPDFSRTEPHKYQLDGKKVHVALGRNRGSKSTWITGQGVAWLIAQMGSALPARSARMGPIHKMASVYVRQVDVGGGQSVFSRNQNELGLALDHLGSEEGGVLFLDDVTEGTKPENAQQYMDWILQIAHRKGITTFLATQDQRLYSARNELPHLAFYTTVPKAFEIRPLEGKEEPERTDWRETAKETALGKHLES